MKVDFWIAVDADGDFGVSAGGESEAVEAHGENYTLAGSLRTVNIKLEFAGPTSTVLTAVIPQRPENEIVTMTVES